jgi:hypothetical protein
MRYAKHVLLTLCSVLALSAPGSPAEPAGKDSVEVLMKKKLTQSQKLLEGIALNDFDRIQSSAEELLLISKRAEWKVLKTPIYEMYSNEFRGNADALVRAAKKKNIDSAALSYVELTLTCVKCHKHVREVRMTRAD